ncbi:MAG: GIY-YIG nuclease family protein [Selenomonadaceae bacterium]|nr:GIY-YIG nuclease family protein [Selenomonadaceae bacterium]
MICIYKITNTVTGDFYIGQTIDFHERELQHKRDPQPKMRDDVEKYGWDAFKFEVVEECSREELNEKENYYITELDPAYNTIKIHNWTHTPETCKKISEALLGHPTAPESCAKMSEKRLGVTLSDEHKEKCRQKSLGNKSRSKAVVCIETGKVYPNMKIAAAEIGIVPSAISGVIRGVNITAGGYHWRYADESAEQGSKKRNVAVICEDTGEKFPTLEAAAKKFGINATTISKIARGESISSLHFKLVEEPEYNEIRTEDKRFGSTSHYTPIICLDNGKEFPSIKDAAEFLDISYQSISSVLNGRAKTAYGYTFVYADGQSHKIIKRKVQCIETGKIFDNVNEAAESVNLSPRTLANHLRGYKKSAGGFHWQYIEDEINEN